MGRPGSSAAGSGGRRRRHHPFGVRTPHPTWRQTRLLGKQPARWRWPGGCRDDPARVSAGDGVPGSNRPGVRPVQPVDAPGPGDRVTEQRVDALPVVAPRRLVVRALLRASLTVTVLVVLYFTLPITGPLDGSAAVRLVVGLLILAGVVTWQIRAVLRSRYPGLRGRGAGRRDPAVPAGVRGRLPPDGRCRRPGRSASR
jgi:hypothetical protein